MQSNEQVAAAEEARIDKDKRLFRALFQEFLEFEQGPALLADKQKRAREVYERAVDHFNMCEQSVANSDLLGAHKNERWVRTKAETSLNTLDAIVLFREGFCPLCTKLNVNLPPLSPTAYAQMQQIVVEHFPDLATSMRQRFVNNQLPTFGFDRPLSPSRPTEGNASLEFDEHGIKKVVNVRSEDAKAILANYGKVTTATMSVSGAIKDSHIVEVAKEAKPISHPASKKPKENEQEPPEKSFSTELALLRMSIAKIPAMRFALGVAGLAGASSIVIQLAKGSPVNFFIVLVVMLFLMVLLFIFSKLTTSKSRHVLWAGIVLLWLVVGCTIFASVASVTSLFLGRPIDWRPGSAKPAAMPAIPTIPTARPTAPAAGSANGTSYKAKRVDSTPEGCLVPVEMDSESNLIVNADKIPQAYNGATVLEENIKPNIFFLIRTSDHIVNNQNFGGFLYEVSTDHAPTNGHYSVSFSFCAWSKTNKELTLRISNQDGHGEDTKLSNVFKLTGKPKRFTGTVDFENTGDSKIRSKIFGWLIDPKYSPANKAGWENFNQSGNKEFIIGNLTLKIIEGRTTP